MDQYACSKNSTEGHVCSKISVDQYACSKISTDRYIYPKICMNPYIRSNTSTDLHICSKISMDQYVCSKILKTSTYVQKSNLSASRPMLETPRFSTNRYVRTCKNLCGHAGMLETYSDRCLNSEIPTCRYQWSKIAAYMYA
jgi:hypothetical protein